MVQKETIFRLTHHCIGQARTIILHRPVPVSAIRHSFHSRLGCKLPRQDRVPVTTTWALPVHRTPLKPTLATFITIIMVH